MIEECATVVSTSEHSVWVESRPRQGCARCEAGEGCGGGILGRLVGARGTRLQVLCSLAGLRAGDEVIIGIDASAVLKSSLLVYGLPLAAMLLAGFAAQSWLLANDLATAGFAGAGLAMGFWWVRRFSARIRNNRYYQPVVLRRAGAGARDETAVV